MGYMPVISVSLPAWRRTRAFSLTMPLIRKLVYAMMYGDLIMRRGQPGAPL